ncbi:CshA/CshB family fibrillar adhesin-related protein, partial [Acinetobacter baumannii]
PFTVTLSGLTLKDKAGRTRVFAMVAADGESTDVNENLVFNTNGGAWKLSQLVPQGTGSCNSLSGAGSTTATWQNSSTCSGNEGSVIL